MLRVPGDGRRPPAPPTERGAPPPYLYGRPFPPSPGIRTPRATAAVSGAHAPHRATSCRAQDRLESRRETLPALELLAQGPSAGGGHVVIAGAAVVVRRRPVARDQPRLLEALQGGVERPLVDLEHALRRLLDPLADPPAVHVGEGERLQYEKVE